jgi:tRNA threonylcarbamoyladenosine biosynthesis protein TsaB
VNSQALNQQRVIRDDRIFSPLSTTALASLGPALAIDSSLGTSVAVSNGSRIVTLSVDDPLGHAEVVADLIVSALNELGVAAADISHVVAGMGPGPFTGLRVGIAAAQGFAAGRGCELLPLVSHEAVALEVFAEHPSREQVFVVTDARRKELFGTRFAAPEALGIPLLVHEPMLFTRAQLDDEALADDPTRVNPERISAGALLELAALRRAANQPFEPHTALYLRAPDVTPSTGPKRVGS